MTLRRAGALLLAFAFMPVAGCGGGSDSGATAGGEPISFELLSQSASASADATSGRFSFDMSLTFSATEPRTSQSSDVAVVFEIWDYDEPVAIELPSASQVADGSAVRG